MPAKAVTLSVELIDIETVAKAVVSRDTVTRIEAEDFDEQGGDPAMGDKAGVKVESCGEGGQNVGSTDAGDYMLYHNIYVKEAGITSSAFGLQATIPTAVWRALRME